MTQQEALKVMGLSAGYTADDLKKKYRELSMQNHPDKGGDVEIMKQINAANDVLKTGGTGGGTGKVDWKEINRKYDEAAERVRSLIIDRFKAEVFTKYFNTLSGKEFDVKVTDDSHAPDKKYKSGMTFTYYRVEFKSKDKETAFYVDFSVDLFVIVHGGNGLSTGEVPGDIPMTVGAYGFHDNKKQKVSSRDYRWNVSQKVFSDPSLVFPEAKLKKIFAGSTKNRIFKKRDMELSLKTKLGATITSPYASIPLAPPFSLGMYRSTMMKTGSWGINGIYEGSKRVSVLQYVSIPESEEGLKMIEHMVKAAKKVKGNPLAVIDKEIEKIKANRGK